MKKSQAAIEFIATYGWMVLAVLIVIGALSYFGVFRSNNLVTGMVTFSNPGLSIVDYRVSNKNNSQNANVEINLINNLGETIRISQGDIVLNDDATTLCTPIVENNDVAGPTDTIMMNGQKGQWMWYCNTPTTMLEGNIWESQFTISYNKIDEGVIHTENGDFNAKIE
jgi:hypothetical protein